MSSAASHVTGITTLVLAAGPFRVPVSCNAEMSLTLLDLDVRLTLGLAP
jgi:hypothetical protein